MKLLAAITYRPTIERVLRHLGLWAPEPMFRNPNRAPRPPDELLPDPEPVQQLDLEFSQIPAWWDSDEAYSQAPPDWN